MVFQITVTCHISIGRPELARAVFSDVADTQGEQWGFVVIPQPSGFSVDSFYESCNEATALADIDRILAETARRVSEKQRSTALSWRTTEVRRPENHPTD